MESVKLCDDVQYNIRNSQNEKKKKKTHWPPHVFFTIPNFFAFVKKKKKNVYIL